MLLAKIQEDLKTALKEKDKRVSLVLRSIIAVIKNKEIELNKREKGIGNEEIEKIILNELKKRKEAEEQYKKAERGELAEEEHEEAIILEKYLPEQMSKEDVSKLIDDIIKELNATNMQDMGKVMKEITTRSKNRVDGSIASSLVREKLE